MQRRNATAAPRRTSCETHRESVGPEFSREVPPRPEPSERVDAAAESRPALEQADAAVEFAGIDEPHGAVDAAWAATDDRDVAGR